MLPLESSGGLRWGALDHLRLLVQHSPDVLTILGDGGVVLFASPAIESLLGNSPEEVIGTQILDYAHPEDVALVAELFAGDRAGRGIGAPVELRLRHRDGRWRPVEAVAAGTPADPDVGGAVVNFRDVAGRASAERLQRLQQRALAATSNAFVIADAGQPDTPIVYVNPRFESMTGYAVEEVLGRNCRFLQGPDRHQPALKELRMAIREGRDCRVVMRNYRKDGSLFWNELYVSPIRDGQGRITNYIGVQNDITQRKATHAASTPATERLSPRELDVLTLLSRGRTNREIARSLTISVSTVKIHVEHILAKLRVRDRTGAAVRAAEIGLLPPD